MLSSVSYGFVRGTAISVLAVTLAACSQSEKHEPSVHSGVAPVEPVQDSATPSADWAQVLAETQQPIVPPGIQAGNLMVASSAATSDGAFVRTGSSSSVGSWRKHSERAPAGGTFASETVDLGTQPAYAGKWRGDTSKPLLVAQASDPPETTQNNPQCAEFAKDPDADVGEVMRAGCEPTLAQMSTLMDNPLGNVAMLFTQFDQMRLEDGTTGITANKFNYMGIAQFPKAVNKDWNLINRVVWSVPSMPLDQDKIDRAADRSLRAFGSAPDTVLPPTGTTMLPIDQFDGRTTGFGDVYYVGLFSPKKPIQMGAGKVVWGLGFDLGFPTATDDILGTGKWLAGPSALGVYLGPKWKFGALMQHYVDYAGDSDRDDVNMTNLQYFYMYSLNDTTSIGAAPNIIANWEFNSDNAFTIPIGLGMNRTFQFGKVPVRIGAEIYYSVVTPDDTIGTEWNFRFYIIPAAPAALFKWMTTPMFGG